MLPVTRLSALALAALAACGPLPEQPTPSQLRSELVLPPMPIRTPAQLAPPDCGKLRQEARGLSIACARETLRGCADWGDCTACSAHDRKIRELAESGCR